jgi:hypothetical protein
MRTFAHHPGIDRRLCRGNGVSFFANIDAPSIEDQQYDTLIGHRDSLKNPEAGSQKKDETVCFLLNPAF